MSSVGLAFTYEVEAQVSRIAWRSLPTQGNAVDILPFRPLSGAPLTVRLLLKL